MIWFIKKIDRMKKKKKKNLVFGDGELTNLKN